MSNLPRILSLGPRPTGNDPLSIILGQLWDAEVEALVLPRMQQKAQQTEQQPTPAALSYPREEYDARRLSPRGFVE